MINTGSLYTLENETLQNKVDLFYSKVEQYQNLFKTMNKTASEMMYLNNDMAKRGYLNDNYYKDWFVHSNFDTTWVTNPNSPEYLANYRFLSFTQETDIAKVGLLGLMIQKASALIEDLDSEINESK